VDLVCEECHDKYHFVKHREVKAGSAPLLTDAEARAHARADAYDALHESLQVPDVIPCPQCGYYQKNMTQGYRASQYVWLDHLAGVSGLCSVVSFLTLVANVAGDMGLNSMAWGVSTVLSALGVYVIVFVSDFVRAQLDPNANWEKNIAVGRTLAIADAEFRSIGDLRLQALFDAQLDIEKHTANSVKSRAVLFIIMMLLLCCLTFFRNDEAIEIPISLLSAAAVGALIIDGWSVLRARRVGKWRDGLPALSPDQARDTLSKQPALSTQQVSKSHHESSHCVARHNSHPRSRPVSSIWLEQIRPRRPSVQTACETEPNHASD
jgi:hypothetical protein